MTVSIPPKRGRWAALLTAFAVLATVTLTAQPAVAAESTTVSHTAVTTTRGTLHQTYYEGDWASNARIHWATTGSFLEVVFVGTKVELQGSTRSGHGTGRVFIDDVEVGTVNYGAATNNTVRTLFTSPDVAEGQHTLRVEAEGWIDHGGAIFTSEPVVTGDELTAYLLEVEPKVETDYTAVSWAPFAAAKAAAASLSEDASSESRAAALADLRDAVEALVEIGGLRAMVDDYATRVPTDFTAESWTSFAAARSAADAVLGNDSTETADVVAAKNALQGAAAELVVVSEGSFQPITNNTFWTDTAGNPIYSQGGGIFQFGDTYYWYGVRYQEAEPYLADPSQIYKTSTFQSITVYTSTDLVNWTFQNDIATRDTALNIPETAGAHFSVLENLGDASWLGRLGVSYNENTGKYVAIIQMNSPTRPTVNDGYSVLFLQGDSPTDDFEYGNLQRQIVNSPTGGTGDQTVFTDEDGKDYLIFSNSQGRSSGFVGKIAESDSLSIEPAVRISRNSAGREGNAMFRLDDTYYMAASALHGWNTSVNYVVESTGNGIQGSYGPEYVLPGTEKDYSHVTQTGFFVTVQGTKQDTVLYAGDRWADFAWNGKGYNQWLPISKTDGALKFDSLSNWELNAVTGEWRVGPANNYVLNPDFAADRVAVSNVTGWTTTIDTEFASTPFVSNPSPGADKSRFALRLGAAGAFSGSVAQENSVPVGVYRLGTKVNTAAGLEYARMVVTGAEGERYELDLNTATSGWQDVQLSDLALTGGSATVSIEARSAGGNQSVQVDGLSLVAQQVDASALEALVATESDRDAASYSAATWPVFAEKLAAARAILETPAPTQAQIDTAVAELEQASAGLASAVVSVSVAAAPKIYAVGEAFDPATLTVTAVRSDGSTVALDASQYTVDGFASDVEGETTVTVNANTDIIATGAEPVAAQFVVTVYNPWDAKTAYGAGRSVAFNGSVWLSSWSTQNQRPGDVNGPWQEIRSVDGTAVWTPTRIFQTGDEVVHNGTRYAAKWWTRNQTPGDLNGPWKVITP
jgi:chitodextrinase